MGMWWRRAGEEHRPERACVHVRGRPGDLFFLNLSGLKRGVLFVCLSSRRIKRNSLAPSTRCPVHSWRPSGRWRNLGARRPNLQAQRPDCLTVPPPPGRHPLGPEREKALGSEAWPHRLHKCSPGPSSLCLRDSEMNLSFCPLSVLSLSLPHSALQRTNNRNENRGSVAKIRIYFFHQLLDFKNIFTW